MKRLLLFALLIYTISAQSCIVRDKKGKKPDIQLIELDDSIRGSGNLDVQVIEVDESNKSGSQDIQVIELDESSKDSSDPEVLALHLSDRQRREAVDNKAKRKFCKKDGDCGPGSICLANLACVKGRRRTIDSLNRKTKNAKNRTIQ